MAHLVEEGGLDALRDDPFTDFEVRCKGKVWKVHKTHLCGNSEALMKHCTEMREAREGFLTFNEDEPEVVERLLTYQYLKEYEDVSFVTHTLQNTSLQSRYGPPGELLWVGIGSSSGGSGPAVSYTSTSPAFLAASWSCEPTSQLRPNSTTVNCMTKDDITAILLLNIRMYSLAHRFGLADLMSLAVHKVMSLEWLFRYCHLEQLLSKIQEVTTPDDIELRYRVFARCVVNHEIVKISPAAVQVMESMSTFGWKMGLSWMEAVAQHASVESATNDHVLVLKGELSSLKADVDFNKQLLEIEKLNTETQTQMLETEKKASAEAQQSLKKKTEKTKRLLKINEARKLEIKKLKDKVAQLERVNEALRLVRDISIDEYTVAANEFDLALHVEPKRLERKEQPAASWKPPRPRWDSTG